MYYWKLNITKEYSDGSVFACSIYITDATRFPLLCRIDDNVKIYPFPFLKSIYVYCFYLFKPFDKKIKNIFLMIILILSMCWMIYKCFQLLLYDCSFFYIFYYRYIFAIQIVSVGLFFWTFYYTRRKNTMHELLLSSEFRGC